LLVTKLYKQFQSGKGCGRIIFRLPVSTIKQLRHPIDIRPHAFVETRHI